MPTPYRKIVEHPHRARIRRELRGDVFGAEGEAALRAIMKLGFEVRGGHHEGRPPVDLMRLAYVRVRQALRDVKREQGER